MTGYLHSTYNWNDPALVSASDELSLWSAHFGALMFEYLPLSARRVLDLACGTGFPLLDLAQRLDRNAFSVGLDPWLAALERAQAKLRCFEAYQAALVGADGAAMPFGPGSFDLILSNLGINNFSDPVGVFNECWRVLRPDGTLALTTNLKGHMREFYAVYAETLAELGLEERLPALERQEDHRVTVERASSLLEQAGFQVRRVELEAYKMRFHDGTAFLNHAFIKAGFLDGWRNILQSEQEQRVFIRLEENLTHLSERQGELSLTIPMAYIEAGKG